jgi:hypothetical protein
MENSLESKLKKVRLISRFVFFGSILLMMSSIYSASVKYIGIIRISISFGVILFIMYWIVPVFFLLIKKQAFALAWSRGLVKWDKFISYEFDTVPLAEKIWMYLNSLLSCFMFVILIWFLGLVSQ